MLICAALSGAQDVVHQSMQWKHLSTATGDLPLSAAALGQIISTLNAGPVETGTPRQKTVRVPDRILTGRRCIELVMNGAYFGAVWEGTRISI